MKYCIEKTAYDEINDILYLHFLTIPSANWYGDEYKGVLMHKDMDTDIVTGMTIFYPKRDTYSRTIELHDLGFNFDLARYLPTR